MIPNLISFREAPKGSLNKTRYGHGEFDTMVSSREALGKNALAVVTFKKEKLLRLKKISDMRPATMAVAIRQVNEETPLLSLIGDRGIENKKHLSFGVETFFCDPHSPWQKPHVENQNGLVRKCSYGHVFGHRKGLTSSRRRRLASIVIDSGHKEWAQVFLISIPYILKDQKQKLFDLVENGKRWEDQ